MKFKKLLLIILVIVLFYLVAKCICEYSEGMENSKCSEEESKKYILGLLRNGFNFLEGKFIDEPFPMDGLRAEIATANKKIRINRLNSLEAQISVNRGPQNSWDKYQFKKYSGKMLTRLLIFSVGSYLKLPEFNHTEELSDDIVNIYINDNRLYDFFKDKELLGYGDLKKLSEICNFKKVMLFGYAFLKGRALETDQKYPRSKGIPLMILEFIKNNINDKNLIVNIVINAIISTFISSGAFKDKNENETKKIILAIRRTLLKLNDVKIQEYVKYIIGLVRAPNEIKNIFTSIDDLSFNMIKQEDDKICNILQESGFGNPSYDGNNFIINMGGETIKFNIDQSFHIFVNKNLLRDKDYKKKLSVPDFETLKNELKSNFYRFFREYEKRKNNLPEQEKLIFTLMNFIHCSMKISDQKSDKVEKENYCGENTEWNENTQKCEYKLTEDVCNDDTRWNQETLKCESNPSDDMCGENTQWSSIKDECVISKNVCGKDTFLSPKTGQCESDGMCNIM